MWRYLMCVNGEIISEKNKFNFYWNFIKVKNGKITATYNTCEICDYCSDHIVMKKHCVKCYIDKSCDYCGDIEVYGAEIYIYKLTPRLVYNYNFENKIFEIIQEKYSVEKKHKELRKKFMFVLLVFKAAGLPHIGHALSWY